MPFNKQNSGQSSGSIQAGALKNIHIAEVVAVGTLSSTPRSAEEKINKNIERFNADEHAIKCNIVGAKYDGVKNVLTREELAKLPNCFPLMPKHTNLIPKVGEFVIVILAGEGETFSDRFYIGPIISSLDKLNQDSGITSLANFADGMTTPSEEISKIPLARGVYENSQNVVIEGRDNTDIIQRPNEVLIRSGKFVINDPLKFNSQNPGFIQIKSDFNMAIEGSDETKQVSVTNIVSNKINLLTYDGSPSFGTMTQVNQETGEAEYINDGTLGTVMNLAHPLVFGDTLIEYLRLMKSALLNHVHNGSGNKPTDKLPASTVFDLNKSAERLEAAMLSKNIRIN